MPRTASRDRAVLGDSSGSHELNQQKKAARLQPVTSQATTL